MYGVMWERENIRERGREGGRERDEKKSLMETKGKHGNTFSLGTFIFLSFSLFLSLSLSLISFVCLSFVFSKPKPMSIFPSSILPCVLGMA